MNYMNDEKYQEAKEIFFNYQGSAFFMANDGVYETYKSYAVPPAISDQWYLELLLKNKEQLLSAANNSEIAWRFYLYLNLIRCNKQYFTNDDIQFAFDYFCKSEKLDNFSYLLMIEQIIDFIKSINQTDNSIKNYCKKILENMNIDSFTVDDSYKYEGKFPSYTLKERVSQRILDDLNDLSNL